MTKIFSHLSPEYIECCKRCCIQPDNGAYYYSKELLENIVPHIKTDRDWVLINVARQCTDRAIVFIHNNKNPERYWWLAPYKDLILVCSQMKTVRWMSEMYPQFHTILLPLSIDTKYVSQFKAKRKTKDTAYFGRQVKCPDEILKDNKIDKLYSKNREQLLREVAKYRKVYAIGRCALEALCLGCEVLPHKGEYEGVEFKLLDNKDVIPELQRLLNEIDGVNNGFRKSN